MRTIEARSIIQPSGNFNLLRGCTHGCIYCDSRSTCYDVGPFEDIAIKKDAIETLTLELARMKTKKILRTGGMSDPYVHMEKDLGLMKQALKAIHDHAHGISVLTKSAMILRDMDLYKAIHQRAKAIVQFTVTTPYDAIARIIEPRVTLPSKRFETLKAFSDQGMTTGIWMTPILPFITDTPDAVRLIVKKAKAAGVTFIRVFGMGTTMREGSRDYFYQALDKHYPTLKDRYIKTYGNKYICDSPRSEELWKAFRESCEAYGMLYRHEAIDALFELRKTTQMTLF